MNQEQLRQRVDEAMADFGPQAQEVLKTQGRIKLEEFVDNKLALYRTRWAKEDIPPLPLTSEALALREEIARDVSLRLKEGRPSAFNPSSAVSIEDEARLEWNGNPLLRKEFGDNFSSWVAYKKAERSGQIRISRSKIIRQEVTA